MDFKKKLRNFFTLTRKANAGFTLVELIVVIAVLAILAGVGSAGYAGYIKAANKGNDKVLVGNIMRAIETGTNSTMFKPADSLTISATSYPVGFVIITPDGTKLLTSGTTISKVEEACAFETATVTKLSSESVSHTCWFETKTESVYSFSTEEIKYCTVHGASPTALSTDVSYVTAFSGCDHFLSHKWLITNSQLSAGTLVADSSVKLVSSNNSSLCEYAYANQNGIFTGSNVVNGANGNAVDTSHPLYQAINAAYGDLGALKLTFDGWTSDEGIDYATFYTAAPGVMSSMETLSGVLAWASTTPVINEYVEGEYANGEAVLSAITDRILTTHSTKDAWLNVWNSAGNQTWDSYGFGLSGRENYSAARIAYNNGFAAYMSANNVDSDFVDLIKNFNAQELLGVGLPGLICTDAFTDTDSPLKQKFKDAGDTNAGEDGSEFNKCAELFEQYKHSSACEENGSVFYDTMVTFDETEQYASDKNNFYGGDVFDYYNAYVNEISALYTAAQQEAGDGIMIIVTMEDGVVKCAVSPAAANPRNK